jgi:hypothetical protein
MFYILWYLHIPHERPHITSQIFPLSWSSLVSWLESSTPTPTSGTTVPRPRPVPVTCAFLDLQQLPCLQVTPSAGSCIKARLQLTNSSAIAFVSTNPWAKDRVKTSSPWPGHRGKRWKWRQSSLRCRSSFW